MQDRKDLDIPVVIDGRLPVGLQMERIDHIDIIQIRRSRLVGQVDRMLERDIPDRKRLKFRVARLDPSLVFVIKLGQTGRHLPASGARRRNNDQRPLCFHIIVPSEAVIAYNQRNIRRIAFDQIVPVDLDALLLHPLCKDIRRSLPVIVRQNDAPYIEAPFLKLKHQALYIRVVGNPQISSDLIFFDIRSINNDQNLNLIRQLHKHS